MKSDCVIVNHDHNIVSAAAGIGVAARSIVTHDPSVLKGFQRQVEVDDPSVLKGFQRQVEVDNPSVLKGFQRQVEVDESGSIIYGFSEACKNLNGIIGSGSRQSKSGQHGTHLLVSDEENFQGKRKTQQSFNDRVTCVNGNPINPINSIVLNGNPINQMVLNGNQMVLNGNQMVINGNQMVLNGNQMVLNGNPMVLVSSTMDQNRSQGTPFDALTGNELHNQFSNGVQKVPSRRTDGSTRTCIREFDRTDGSTRTCIREFDRTDGSTRTCIRDFDTVNGAFNERNPGAGGLFDASLVSQVNLAAAFHDHISYTKIGSEITKTGGFLLGFNGAPSGGRVDSDGGFLLGFNGAPSGGRVDSEGQSLKEDGEQMSRMKRIILTHLDLIQHQQEMLLKKDRQLQGLKQDRESLLSRLEKMDKKISIMTKKFLSFTHLPKHSDDHHPTFTDHHPTFTDHHPTFKSKLSDTKSTGSSSVSSSSSSSSPLFSDYFSSESASNALFIKLTNESSLKLDDSRFSSKLDDSRFSLKLDNSRFSSKLDDSRFSSKLDDSRSSDMMVIRSDGPLRSPVKKCRKSSPSKSSRKRIRSGSKIDVTVESKSVRRSSSSVKRRVSSARKKQSSTSSTSSTISSLESYKSEVNEALTPTKPAETPAETPTETPAETPTEIPFNFITSEDLYEVVNMWDIEDLEQEERKKVMCAFKLPSLSVAGLPSLPVTGLSSLPVTGLSSLPVAGLPSLPVTGNAVSEAGKVVGGESGRDGEETEKSCDAEMIEVPSWRIVNITGSYVMEGTENLEDDVYNKRHSKMEIDERRRKRWDIQRLREQRHNEKLKQGRYYSKAAFVSTDLKSYQPSCTLDSRNDPQPVSFFPDPMDAEVIEVCDQLPLVAFGHPIPILPQKPFLIPWVTRWKSDRKASQLVSNPQSKSKKITETNQGTLLLSKLDETNLLATETTSRTIMSSASRTTISSSPLSRTTMPSSSASRTIMPSSSSSASSKSGSTQTVPKGTKSFCSTKKLSISVT